MDHFVRVCWFINIIFFLFDFDGIAQDKKYSISGTVIDIVTKEFLHGVTIVEGKTSKGEISDREGKFVFEFEKFPILLVYKHIGYYSDTLQVQSEELFNQFFKNKTIHIELQPDPVQIEPVIVTSRRFANELFTEEPFAIMDYVIKDGFFIALGYKNNNQFNRELLFGKIKGKIEFSLPLNSCQEIFQDCLGELYAITKDSVTHLIVEHDSIEFNESFNTTFFEDYVRPIKAFDDSIYIYLIQSKNSLYQDYYIYDIENQSSRNFYRVGDYSLEQGYENIDKQIKSQIVNKIRRGFIPREQMRIINDRISHQMYRRFDEYRPVVSTMIQIQDSVLLFDFGYNVIHCFKTDAELKWRKEIKIDLTNHFTGRVHHDKITDRFFLEFIDGQLSYLREVDPLTGECLITIPILKFKHIDHINLYDNKIFFLHQPDFGNKGKKLYYIDI